MNYVKRRRCLDIGTTSTAAHARIEMPGPSTADHSSSPIPDTPPRGSQKARPTLVAARLTQRHAGSRVPSPAKEPEVAQILAQQLGSRQIGSKLDASSKLAVRRRLKRTAARKTTDAQLRPSTGRSRRCSKLRLVVSPSPCRNQACYNGKTPWKNYQKYFERLSVINGWTTKKEKL